MPELDKSDVLKNVISTLINVSSRKTDLGFAISTMNSLIKQLENKYDFLKHVQIRDIRYSEENEAVSIVSDMNNVDPKDMGQAIHAIITTMNRSLGKNAGHFFMKEIQNNLGDDYNSTIKDLGVDLSLLQLEHEVSEWRKIVTTKIE